MGNKNFLSCWIFGSSLFPRVPYPSPKIFHKGEAKALNFVQYQTSFSVLTHFTSTVWISALSSFWVRTSYPCLLIWSSSRQPSVSQPPTQPDRTSIFHPICKGVCWISSAARSKPSSISPPSRITATWRRKTREAERTFRQGKGFQQESIAMMM